MNMIETLDGILNRAVDGKSGRPGAPGVVAVATTRDGLIYQGASGVRCLSSGTPMTPDTVLALMSCTKAITGTAVMQLVEGGSINLDDPAKLYVSEIGDIRVLDGFDSDGAPILRRPNSDITIRHLMLHTAGFGYDFFNYDLLRYGQIMDVPSVVTATMASLRSVLLFDPGTRWEYGTNIDWLGKVLESVLQKPLGDILKVRVLDPLEMTETNHKLTPSMQARRASIHQRTDSAMTPLPEFVLPQEAEQHMGGHFLYGPATDYIKFIQMILNDGNGPRGRLLKKATVDFMTTNGLGKLQVTRLPGAIPSLSLDAEFFPGMPKSWGFTWMINDRDAPTGRPAGAVAWAGLANTYYWIDRQNGLGGFWGSQILPFVDEASTTGYLEFETAIYSSRNPQT